MALINVRGRLIDLGAPKVMGILNVTPDSFYDGGQHFGTMEALEKASLLLEDGADILDIGAYSSRPGAEHISAQEEIDRLLPVVEQLVKQYPESILSIDTFRAEVAEAALLAGAHIINDIGGGNLDENMFAIIAQWNVPYILMHSRGTPKTMQQQTGYRDIVEEMLTDFSEKITTLRHLGVKDIILDPGFGFAKTLTQNYEVLKQITAFKIFGLPILGALSRKSMIYKALNKGPKDALNGTTVLNTILLLRGVNLLRVHDVKEAQEIKTLLNQLGLDD